MLEATWPPPRPSQWLHVWMAACVFQMSNHINRGLHLHVGSLQFIFRSPECTNDDDTASIRQCVEDWAFRFFLVNTHYCWFVGDNSFTAAQGCFTLSMFPANSGFSFFFFFLRLDPQKYSVDKILFLASPASSVSLEEEEKNRREWASPDPAEWEGCSAGGLKGGKSSVSFFFFLYTFPFPRSPGGSTLSSALHRKQAGQVQLSTGLWLRRLPERCLNTSRQEAGGTQYWLRWCREQTVCTWSLEQRPACSEQKGEMETERDRFNKVWMQNCGLYEL